MLYVYLLMLTVGPGRLQISDDMSRHLIKIDVKNSMAITCLQLIVDNFMLLWILFILASVTIFVLTSLTRHKGAFICCE